MTCTSSLPPKRLFFATCVLSFLTQFPMGWSTQSINIPEPEFLQFINQSFHSHYGYNLTDSGLESVWSLVVNLFYVAAILASLLCMKIIPYTGLRNGISFFGCIGTILGSIVLSVIVLCNSFELLALGRLMIGMSIFYSNNLLFIMLPECSPNYCRGFVTILGLTVGTISICIGTIAGLPQVFGVRGRFWMLFGFPIIPMVIQMMIYRKFPDSPKRLYIHIKDKLAAAESIKFYHGNETDIDAVFAEYEEEVALEKETMTFWEVVTSKTLRKPLCLCLLETFGVYFSGLAPVALYSTHIIKKAGTTENIANMGTTVVQLMAIPAIIASLWLIDSLGRRFLIISGFTTCCVCLVGFIVFPNVDGKVPAYLDIVCLTVYLFAMNWGPLNIGFFLPSELLPFQARSVGIGLNGALLCVCIILTGQMYGGLNEQLGSYIFIIFLVPTVIVTVILYCGLPETKNTTSKETSDLMNVAANEAAISVAKY